MGLVPNDCASVVWTTHQLSAATCLVSVVVTQLGVVCRNVQGLAVAPTDEPAVLCCAVAALGVVSCCPCSLPLWCCHGFPAGRLWPAEPVPGHHVLQMGKGVPIWGKGEVVQHKCRIRVLTNRREPALGLFPSLSCCGAVDCTCRGEVFRLGCVPPTLVQIRRRHAPTCTGKGTTQDGVQGCGRSWVCPSWVGVLGTSRLN